MPDIIPEELRRMINNQWREDAENRIRAINMEAFRPMPKVNLEARIAPPLMIGAALDERAFIVKEEPIPVKKNKKEKILLHPESLGTYLGEYKEGLFGIEIEVEGDKIPTIDNKEWNSVKDGSLRGESNEYVLNGPMSPSDAKTAIVNLTKALKKNKSVLDFSYRTSVHVHVNVLSLTKPQIISFLYLSHLLEDILVNYSGETRIGNRFCLRIKDAEYKLFLIRNWIKEKGFKRFNVEDVKYSAINPAPMRDRGSIEFRSMRGTLDTDILFPWLSVLENLHNISAELDVLTISEIAHSNPEKLLDMVFGEHLNKFKFDGMINSIREAYSLLIEIPYLKVG